MCNLGGIAMLKSGVLKRFIISYTVVLLLPIFFISSLIYTHFVNNFTDEVINSTSRMLIKAQESMDINIRNLNSISAQVSINPNITPLISYQFREQLSLYPHITGGIKELNNYKVTNQIIDNILIFLKDRNTVISNVSKYAADDYFNNISIWNNKEGKAFCDMLNALKNVEILPSQAVADSGEKYNIIASAYPLPLGSSEPSTVLLITIREAAVQQLVNKALGAFSGHIYILDAMGRIMMETAINGSGDNGGGQEEGVKTFLDNIKDEDRNVYNEKREDSIFCYVKSEMNNWKYVAVMPAGQILSRVNYLKKYYILIVFAVLVIGLILVILFSGGNYKNVKRITDVILAGNHGLAHSTYKNEWNFINKSIHNYISENETLQQKMTDQLPAIKNNFLSRLVKGDLHDPDTIKKMAGFLNIDISSFESFAVLFLNLEGNERFFDENTEDVYNIVKLAISNAAEEQCREWGKGYTVELEKVKIALIGFMEYHKDFSAKTISANIAENIRAFIKEKFELNMTIAVSSPHSSISDMAVAYAEAETALDYKLIKGENSIIYFGELGTRDNPRYYYSFEQEKIIVNHLRRGDYPSIKEILDRVVNRTKNEPIALESVKCMYFELVNTAIKALNELDIPDTWDRKALFSILNCSTLDKIYEEVCSFYDRLCDFVNNAKHLKNEDLSNKIHEYVQSNYHNSSLSVELVADAFAISPSYLSRLFKEQSGGNFIDYVHYIRLEKAKELLSSSEETIACIAGKTGYNSIYNFTRVFKRYEGVTPTEYRSSKYRQLV